MLLAVIIQPIDQVSWAYRLHSYLLFGTHRRRPAFSNCRSDQLINRLTEEICTRHGYHILKLRSYLDHIRLLLNLQPGQTISSVAQTIEANSSREYSAMLQTRPPLWAKGFLARTVGKVRVQAVAQYIDSQAEHHGFARRVRPPVFRYRAGEPVTLTAGHGLFELNHHLVFSARRRAPIFDSLLGAVLGRYWLEVADRRGFAIDRMTILDHGFLVRIGLNLQTFSGKG
ncbi:MAG TPA: IS200/IS605 family transposase [Blastocatellia bacterium]